MSTKNTKEILNELSELQQKLHPLLEELITHLCEQKRELLQLSYYKEEDSLYVAWEKDEKCADTLLINGPDPIWIGKLEDCEFYDLEPEDSQCTLTQLLMENAQKGN